MTEDVQMLRRFADSGDEAAFRELVGRHLDLVYSAALRQLNGDTHLAEDVAQSVFADLARKARTLRPDIVLSGWLYEAARFAAAKAVRREQRRRAREQEIMAMHDLTPESTRDWEQLHPVLDNAMGELTATDRNAVLLRFFQRKDLATVGRALGVSEDAAQKRVGRALEKLRTKLLRHGVALSAPTLATVMTGAAVHSAPAALASSIGTTALIGAASVGSTAGLATLNILAMTKLKVGIVSTVIIAGLATPLVLQHQTNAKLKKDYATLRQQLDQTAALTSENERLSNLLRQATEPKPTSPDTTELLQLRAEVARLRNASDELARLKADNSRTAESKEDAAKLWMSRLQQLKQRLELTPTARIPEFKFLTEEDWLSAAKRELNTEDDYRRAFAKLRSTAEGKFAPLLRKALSNYRKSNNKDFPSDLSQLQAYFDSPVDETILQRWEIAPASRIRSLQFGGDVIITQREPVDELYDTQYGIGPDGGYGSTDFLNERTRGAMDPVFAAFIKANGEPPEDLSRLRPYTTTAEQKLALEKMIQKRASEK